MVAGKHLRFRASPVSLVFGGGLKRALRNFFNRAIGDSTQAGYLEEMHKAGHAAYLQRVTSDGQDLALSSRVGSSDYGQLILALEKRIQDLEGKLANRREEIRRAKEVGREAMVRQREMLEELRHRLRYLGANPLRALALWWRKGHHHE